MAEFLWTFAVQEVLKKVVKLAAGEIGLIWGLKEDLSKMIEWLHENETFLCDINTRKLHRDSVRRWLQKLQHLVHEADDLLDELMYEDLRRKVETGKMKRVRNLLSLSNNSLVFRLNMARKIKNLTNLLYQHCGKASYLGLVGDESSQIEMDLCQLRETVSKLDEHEVVGRDIEVSSIVKQVIDANNQQVTSILPIVGMGGLGKTTLAKLIFNHETVKEHFDKTVWLCVSEPFLINKILGAILQTLKGTSGGSDNREVLLRELQKEMHGKKYFLVLDDVWNEKSYLWDELKSCLTWITEKSGNIIIVTTRSVDAAKIMETLPSHHLSKLSDDQCWSLFKENANAIGPQMASNLEVVREELVKKIGGLPLVARVLGRAVKFQGDYKGWATSLENVARTPLQEENSVSTIARTPLQEKNHVLSILKLSVDHLPSPSLKQCFAYCSNFPKDFKFEKESLVQMWMAQGFIQPQEGRSNMTMEDIGDVYFNILLSRCLFQDVIKDARGGFTSCKMHDLIHDIACVVSNDQKLQDHRNLWTMNGTEKIASQLRTIVFQKEMLERIDKVIHGKIVNFVYLRVLIMNLWEIVELPDSIGKLKHLRYLDISDCRIKKLPKSIVLLYNLQTLKGNSNIKYLPKNLRQLVSLRHLEFGITCLHLMKQMPQHLSQLIQLQTLSGFIVGIEEGCRITELGPLKNLKGSLKLLQLEQVKSKEEARYAKLVEKKLSELFLYWTREEERGEGVDNNDLEVLEGLQPHKNLQSLKIEDFAGKRLPNNIFVENLVAIKLFACGNCEMLPMLGQLANLEELDIRGFNNVRSIGNEFYGNDSNQRTFFSKLKKFELKIMKNLKEWEEVIVAPNVTTFPHLQYLNISDCPNLLNIPNVFGFCDENGVKHLTSLKLDRCFNLNLNFQNENMLSELAHITNLKELDICRNMQDLDFSFLMHLPSLIKLDLCNLSRIATSLPQQLEHLIALQHLSIKHFDGIEVLPECLGKLTSLKSLKLSHCNNLKQLPSREAMLRLTKLRYLEVIVCYQLQLGKGDLERAKVSHVPTIKVY